MASPAIELRRAGLDDLDVILSTFLIGLESYAAFAPPGWSPGQLPDERERTADLLSDPDTWTALALAAGEPVGHVGVIPARERAIGERAHDWRDRPPLPGVAHLWQLFVLPDWWGTGVAGTLHEAAVAEIGARGYQRARLVTPSDHARARRFYGRRGWVPTDEGWDPGLGLDLVEYRLELEAGS